MTKFYEGKEYIEVKSGVWKPINEVTHLEETIEFIEDYLGAERNFIDNVDMHAIEIIKLMDKIRYTL